MKHQADRVFEGTGRSLLVDIALGLEQVALADDSFVSRKLYPNVYFYSGIINQAMGFPTEAFPVPFAIPRTAGWLSQWKESLEGSDLSTARPRQIYLGSSRCDHVSLDARTFEGRNGV